MSYAAAETSVENGAPYELLLFRSRFSGMFRLTTESVDRVSFAPFFGRGLFGRQMFRDTWSASGARRGEVSVGTAEDKLEITVTRTSPLAEFLLRSAFYDPVDVDVYRGHDTDPTNTLVLQYRGTVVSAELSGPEVKVTCQSFLAQLGQIAAGRAYTRLCSWPHYGTECGLDRAAFEFAGTVTARNGVIVTVPEAAARPAGDLIAGGLRIGNQVVVIRNHAGNQLELGFVPPALVGATLPVSVMLSPGCSRKAERCAAFGNLLNFGGFENMPEANVFDGMRIYTQWRA